MEYAADNSGVLPGPHTRRKPPPWSQSWKSPWFFLHSIPDSPADDTVVTTFLLFAAIITVSFAASIAASGCRLASRNILVVKFCRKNLFHNLQKGERYVLWWP